MMRYPDTEPQAAQSYYIAANTDRQWRRAGIVYVMGESPKYKSPHVLRLCAITNLIDWVETDQRGKPVIMIEEDSIFDAITPILFPIVE